MKLKSILIFSILLSTTTIYGKKNLEFESGYIITNRGDTIHGELVVFEKTKSQLVIQFQNDSKKYRAHKKEVRAYKRGNKLFELKTFILSGKFSYSQRFLQVVSKGKVNLYLYISKIPEAV